MWGIICHYNNMVRGSWSILNSTTSSALWNTQNLWRKLSQLLVLKLNERIILVWYKAKSTCRSFIWDWKYWVVMWTSIACTTNWPILLRTSQVIILVRLYLILWILILIIHWRLEADKIIIISLKIEVLLSIVSNFISLTTNQRYITIFGFS